MHKNWTLRGFGTRAAGHLYERANTHTQLQSEAEPWLYSFYAPAAQKITCNLFAQNEKISATYNESNNWKKQIYPLKIIIVACEP